MKAQVSKDSGRQVSQPFHRALGDGGAMSKTAPLFAALSIMLFAGAAQAQSVGLAGKPCALDDQLKGTCFYRADGHLVYWIVRFWKSTADGGGPDPFSTEFVGYPAVLKKQEDYNQWVKSASAPGLSIEDDLANHRFGAAHGWEERQEKISIPARIRETGAIDRNTLLIPLFKTGAMILAAADRLRNDCISAVSEYVEWDSAHPGSDQGVSRYTYWQDEHGNISHSTRPDPYFSSSLAREDYLSFCTAGDVAYVPINRTFAARQQSLNARAVLLEAAMRASRQFQAAVTELFNQGGAIESQLPIAWNRLPAGFAGRLSGFQATIDDSLNADEKRAAAAVEQEKQWGRYERELACKHFADLEDDDTLSLLKCPQYSHARDCKRQAEIGDHDAMRLLRCAH